MIFDAATLIRAASGVVFLGVGLIIAWASRHARERRPANAALATACGAFGASFLSVNLLAADRATAALGVGLQTTFVASTLVATLVFLFTSGLRAHVRTGDALVGVVALVGAYGFSRPAFTEALFRSQAFAQDAYAGLAVVLWHIDTWVVLMMLGAFALVTLAAARAHAAATTSRERTAMALLSIGLFAYPAFMAGLTLALAAQQGGFADAAVPIALLLALAAGAWLRRNPWVALVLLVAALSGQLGPISGIHVAGVGVLRIGAAALVAVAALRYGLAGADLHSATAQRGSWAAGALAVVFIVAQVAQDFLAAEYGLLMGGVVAGALLFAANPIQRTMERVVEARAFGIRAPPGAAGTDGTAPRVASDGARREEVYRDALRVALRDRRITRDEEVRLHRLAEELGIGAGRAHAILVEVENEGGAR